MGKSPPQAAYIVAFLRDRAWGPYYLSYMLMILNVVCKEQLPTCTLLYANMHHDQGYCVKSTESSLWLIVDYKASLLYETNITCSSTDRDSLLRNINNEMSNVAEWMRLNKLSLNADKSEFMVIGHSRQQNNLKELREIEVNLKKIRRVTKTKFLGLNIDDNLSWKDQHKKVKTKVKSGLSAIRKLRWNVTLKGLRK